MGELDKIYTAVSAKFDIGDAESFKQKMQTPADRKKFYEVVGQKGFDLGDYDQYETRLSASASPSTGEKKKEFTSSSTNSADASGQDGMPSAENGELNYQWSGGIETPLKTGTEGTPPAKDKGNPYLQVFEQQKKAKEHLTNADVAQFDSRIISENPKVKEAYSLHQLIADTKDEKAKADLETKFQALLDQPVRDESGPQWEGYVNGRKVDDSNDILKGKTVRDAVDMLKGKKEEYDKNVAEYNTMNAETKANIEKMRETANFQLSPDKAYRELGALENFIASSNHTTGSIIDGIRYRLADEQGRKDMLKEKMAEQQVFPEQAADGIGTKAAGMAGGILPFIALGTVGGGAAGTVGGILTNTLAMGLSGYSNAAQEAYAEKIQETGNEEEAFKVADDMAKIGAGVGAAEGISLSLMGGGKLPTGVREMILKTAQKNTVLGGMFGGARYIENKLAQLNGIDRDEMSGVKETAIDGFILGVAMDGVHSFPKMIGKENVNKLQNVLARYSFADVTQAVDNAVQAGVMDNAAAQKTMAPIQEKAAAFSQMPETMEFGKQEQLLPLMIERNKLVAEKEKTAEAFHGGIDAKIEDLNRQISEEAGYPLSLKEQTQFDKLKEKKDNPESKLTAAEKELHDHYNAREKSNLAVNNITDTPHRVTYKDGRTGLLHKNSEGDFEFTPDGNSQSVVFDKGGTVNEKSIKQLGFRVESKNELGKPDSQIVSGEVAIDADVVYKGKRYKITENKNAPEGFKTDAEGNVRLLYLKDDKGNRIVVGADNADGKSLINDANKLIGKKSKDTKPEVSIQEPVESKPTIENAETTKPATDGETVTGSNPENEKPGVETETTASTETEPITKPTGKKPVVEKITGSGKGDEPPSVKRQKSINALLDKVDEFNNLSNGPRGKASEKGGKLQQEIQEQAKGLGLNFKRSGRYIKVENTAGGKVKRSFAFEGNRAEAENHTPLEKRDSKTIELFNELSKEGVNHLPEVTGADGKRMSAKQLKQAMEDVMNGNNTNGAELLLNKFDETIRNGIFEITDTNTRETVGVPIEEYLEAIRGAEKEAQEISLEQAEKERDEYNEWLKEQPEETKTEHHEQYEEQGREIDEALSREESDAQGDTETGGETPEAERQQQQERLSTAEKAYAKAESEYTALNKALTGDLKNKQTDMFGGKEQKLFDDTGDMATRVEEAKRKMDEAKTELDRAQDVVDANLEGQKKLFGKDKIADGLDELINSIGGIKKAAGDERPDAMKAIRKIVDGLYDVGGVSAKNVWEKIKALLKEKYGKVDLNKIEIHQEEAVSYARQLEKKSFIKTVKNSAKTTEEFKAKVEEIEEDYQVLTNKEAMAKADAEIGLDLGEVKKRVMDTSVPASAEKSVLAMRLMKHYEKVKDFDSAVEVLNSYDNQLREAGRFIQAASLWNKVSPEVVVRSAKKVAEELGVTLKPEVSKQILEQMSKVDAMPEGVEKQKATLEVLDYIADQLPLKWSEYLDAFRYQNMLSNPKSHLRNIYSNMLNQLITRPFDLATLATYDYLRHPLNPVAREVSYSDVPKYYKELVTSIPNAVAGFKEAITSGYITDKVMDLGSTGSKIEALRKSKLPAALTMTTRFLEAQDSFFSIMIAQGEKARLMRTGMSDRLAGEAAGKLANDYLYRTKLGNTEVIKIKPVLVRALDAAGVFTDQLRKAPTIGKVAGYFIPFVRTPINVVKFGLEHSPAGFIGGDYSREQVSKATLGSVVMGMGALAAAQGITTWAAPKDKQERKLFYASGRKPYSIKVGNRWVPMMYAGPFAFSLAMPAALKHFQEDTRMALTDNEAKKIGDSIMSMIGFITNQTSLTGVDTFFKTFMGDEDHNLMQSLGFTSEQFLPLIGMVKYINSIYDPIFRKAHGFMEAIEKDLPILSEELDAYTDERGQPAKRDQLNYFLPYDMGLNKEQLGRSLEERRKLIQEAEKIKQEYLEKRKK